MSDASTDVPLCKRVLTDGSVCGGPRTEMDHEGLASGFLRCCMCGYDDPATPEELAQARKADAAWDAENGGEPAEVQPAEPAPQDDKTLPLFPEVTRG